MSTQSQVPAAGRIRDVQAHSAGLVKELGLANLVLIQIMYVVGTFWVGTAAAKLGSSHLWFWLAAAASFYLPQAAVVIYLNRLMPLEGGLYQWANVGLGKFWGFLVAWNLWAYAVLIMATFGVMIAQNLPYLFNSTESPFFKAAWYAPTVSVSAVVGITIVSVVGLGVAKWIQSIAGLSQFFIYGALISLPILAIWQGRGLAGNPMAVTRPEIDMLSLNVFGKLAVGAFSGFEYVAILAGECKSPARTIGRSVLIAVPVIAAMFILGTGGILAVVPANEIDLISPIPQALTIGFGGLGYAAYVAPMLILLLIVRQVGNMTLLFAGTTRLPMVAGWDGLLPAWFTRLHPHLRTPVNSVLFVGALTVVLTLAGQANVGMQEAFQVLENIAGIFYGFVYLALFAIPLVAAGRLNPRPPLWLQAASLAGFSVTLLYCVLSVFPIIDDVEDKFMFSAKIIAVLVVGNLIGIGIYAMGGRQQCKVSDS